MSTTTSNSSTGSSFPFYKPDDDSQLIYHPNVNKKEGFQAIKSCTLAKIIEKLTVTVNFDTYFASAFFLTYRDFTTPLELVSLLVQRYAGPPEGSSKDNLRLFEIEVDVVQVNVINIVRQMISTLTIEDFNNSKLHEEIQEFFNSLPEDIKNELFMIYFKTRKAVRPPTVNSNLASGTKTQVTGSAASTMRFSFSVSPKTQSPSSTNGVLTGLLQQPNSSSPTFPSDSSSSSSSSSTMSSLTTSTYNGNSKSMKLGKGIMAKILQSGGNISSIPELSSISTGSNGSNTSPNGTLNSSNGMPPLNSQSKDRDSKDSEDLNSDQTSDKPSFVPEIIARELTLMEWELITALTLTEFTQKSYKEHKGAAVNIANLTTWFNRISSWVTTKIISKETPEERATIIEAFITIANYAKDLRNYNCVMEILGSLHSSSISRLKNSWSLVSAKGQDIFSQLNQLMSPDINFKNYRKILLQIPAHEPCIPYLGLFLTDFIYLDESNPPFSIMHPHMINIERIFLIGTRVQEFFKLFTNCQYTFQSNPHVREAILSEKVWDENETFRLSRLREESSSANSNSPSTSHISRDSRDHHHGSSSGNSSSISNSSSSSFPISSSSSLSSSSSFPTTTTRRKNFVTKYRMNKKYLNFGDTNNNLYRILSGRVKVEPFCINRYNNNNNNNNNNSSGSSTPPISEESSPNLSKSMNLEMNQNTGDYIYLEEGDIFGEEAFLYDKPSLTTIMAESEDLELIQIEKTFILQLFSSEPILSATFYKYIAVLMAERLKVIYANFHPSGSVQSVLGNGNGGSGLPLISNSLKNSTSSPTLSKMNMDYSKRRSTIYETPTSLDAIRDGNDNKFRSTFGLSNLEEVIIKSYQCKHNNINGVLYITKHHLCFEGKFLTLHKQKTSPFSSITKILPYDKNTLGIYTKDKIKKFTFKTAEDLSEAHGLVAKIWKNHHTPGTTNTSSTASTSSSTSSSPSLTTNASGNNSPSPSTSTTPTLVNKSVQAASTPPVPPKSPKVGRGESFSNITDLPTRDEWNLILKGAKSVTFKKGDILMSEGVEYQKIFQIIKGECAIVKSIIGTSNLLSQVMSGNQSPTYSPIALGGAEIPTPQSLVDPKSSITISKISQGSIYGEMTFLLTGGCSTSLVVTSDEVEVFILESYFLNIMLKSKPQLAPKFYKYLACVLESRVKQYRQQTLYI
ncbi:RasGEF domain-containing protein [Tieghemostelium lacteum]|uniref:RasGEF domain-containing protein n=1 Tax=Tieghemostelium lacteum TaxID=361077 RepID=A0A151ZH61_TIELA|nr:RasGEF domain-containing protein [Tieghemostelium lacteum]|eukprot:KYQ93328.1 RasGEF domain-containing protein [Tieghemostelium lacteum]